MEFNGPHFRPFIKLGLQIEFTDMKRFEIDLGIICFALCSFKYGPGWHDIDFYIDTWAGSWGHSFEVGEYNPPPRTDKEIKEIMEYMPLKTFL